MKPSESGEPKGVKMSVQITKQSITLAFFKLLETKPYKKITVSDVAAAAGLNRMTFYYHFKDIDDLVIKTIEENFLNIVGSSAASGDYLSAYLNVYLIVAKHRELAKKVYPEFDMQRLVSFISPLAFKLSTHLVKQRVPRSVSAEMRKIIAHAVGCCMIGAFIDWLNSDMETDPREMIGGHAAFFNATIDALAAKK